MRERLRIGTRGSPLALRQAGLVARALERAWPGLAVELVPIRTSGDRFATANLAAIGGKGLFVKEIEEALLAGRVELAVHSLKDLPAELPEGLGLVGFPEREDPRDALVTRGGGGLDALAHGSRVGTSSLRRRVQLLWRRPDLIIAPIRGNVETRLRKLHEGPYEGVVLAAAGLNRLGLTPDGVALLEPEEMLPAGGQGILALEARADDPGVRELVGALEHGQTRNAAEAERAFLETIGGSCTTPVGVYARASGTALRLDGLVATPDGARVLRDGQSGPPEAAAALGRHVATRMLAAGATEIIRAGETG